GLNLLRARIAFRHVPQTHFTRILRRAALRHQHNDEETRAIVGHHVTVASGCGCAGIVIRVEPASYERRVGDASGYFECQAARRTSGDHVSATVTPEKSNGIVIRRAFWLRSAQPVRPAMR